MVNFIVVQIYDQVGKNLKNQEFNYCPGFGGFGPDGLGLVPLVVDDSPCGCGLFVL